MTLRTHEGLNAVVRFIEERGLRVA